MNKTRCSKCGKFIGKYPTKFFLEQRFYLDEEETIRVCKGCAFGSPCTKAHVLVRHHIKMYIVPTEAPKGDRK